MATEPKIKWWNIPLKDVKPLHKGLIVGMICGLLVVALFFLFLVPRDNPDSGIIYDESYVVISGNEQVVVNGNETLISSIGFLGLPNDAFTWYTVLVIIVGLNIAHFSMNRRISIVLSIITSGMIFIVFQPMPAWLLVIVIAMPLLHFFWHNIRRGIWI